MSMLLLRFAGPCCMSMLHVHTAFPRSMSLLHVRAANCIYAASPFCVSMLLDSDACLCCMSVLHFHAVCPMSMQHIIVVCISFTGLFSDVLAEKFSEFTGSACKS
jgi:hypothetical protein